MATLLHIGTYILALAASLLLGAMGVFLGPKLARLRPHRKSEEVQTLFSNHHLD